jgi:CRP/FNR family transcriptional regulator
VPIFKELAQEEINRVVDLIVRKRYVKGEMIVMEGGVLDGLMIINQGKVKAFRYTQEGKEQILYIFSEGDFFGEKNLLRQQEVSYNAEALEETHICMIPKKSFRQLLMELPDISYKIMDELCVRIDRLEGTIQNMGSKNMEARVNSVLLEFSQKYGSKHSKGILVELPLSREGIANYIGVARETVSRKMGYLQDEGIIEMIGNKKVLILDMEALELEISE